MCAILVPFYFLIFLLYFLRFADSVTNSKRIDTYILLQSLTVVFEISKFLKLYYVLVCFSLKTVNESKLYILFLHFIAHVIVQIMDIMPYIQINRKAGFTGGAQQAKYMQDRIEILTQIIQINI